MKVLLLICIISGLSNATLPGLNGDAASNILQDLLGGTQGLVRFLRGNTNRIQGGGGGDIVDGKGSGIGHQTSNNGYVYEHPAPKPIYGPPPIQQTVSTIETQNSYLPPAPINPQPHYGPPPTLPPVAPKPVYIVVPVQQTYIPPAPVNPQPHYGPPPSLPHAPKPVYGPPPVQQFVSAVETQSSYLPPAPVNPQPCYGPPVEPTYSSSQGSSSGFSESGPSGDSSSSGSFSGNSGFEEIFK